MAPSSVQQRPSRIAEYGAIRGQALAQRTVLGTAFNPRLRRTYTLTQVDAGWEPAGSMARWTDGYYSVTFELDGSRNGRRFTTQQEAVETFLRWSEVPD
jgi:hypothetical protein